MYHNKIINSKFKRAMVFILAFLISIMGVFTMPLLNKSGGTVSAKTTAYPFDRKTKYVTGSSGATYNPSKIKGMWGSKKSIFRIKRGGDWQWAYCLQYDKSDPVSGQKMSASKKFSGVSAAKKSLMQRAVSWGWNASWGDQDPGVKSKSGVPSGVDCTASEMYYATQLVIWEIDEGLRTSASQGAFTSSKTKYFKAVKGGAAEHAYNYITKHMKDAIPNFSRSLTLKKDGTTYSKTVTDKDKTGSAFYFSNGKTSITIKGVTISVKKVGNNYTFKANKKFSGVISDYMQLANRATKNKGKTAYCYSGGGNSVQKIGTFPNSRIKKMSFTVEGEPEPGKAKIVKTSDDGEVEGITFTVTNSKTGEKQEVVTDKDGVIEEELEAGTYIIEEDVPDGYEADNPRQPVTLAAGENKTVSFKNEKNTPKLKISKTTNDGGSVEGFSFNIRSSDGKVDKNATTDSQGLISEELDEGTYTVTELMTDAQKKIYQPTKPQTVTLSKDSEDMMVVFENRHWPEIHTTATDANTKEHVAVAGKTTISDNVEYKYLDENTSYVMKGTLVDSETGESIKDSDGKAITAEKEFDVADQINGTVTLDFNIDASKLKGKSVVAFEELYKQGEDNSPVTEHKDKSDKGQTVQIPDIGTRALVDGEQIVPDSNDKSTVTLVDTVSYKNLVAGKTYKIKGKLMDKDTGEAVKKGGQNIVKEIEFTPQTSDGTVDVPFEIDAAALRGKVVVAFESLSIKDVELVAHEDINDDDQSVYFPMIKTSAIDSATKDNVGHQAEKITITDTVTYEGLKPGKKYEMTGVLMTKDPQEELLVGDSRVVGSAEFTPNKPDGTVDVGFNFNSSDVKNKTLVVFERCLDGDKEIASHQDINDEGQTVYFPEVGTTAIDVNTKEHIGKVTDKTTIKDTVEYKNFVPNKEYVLKGTLMDKESGKPLLIDGKEVMLEKPFTPTEANGAEEIEFEVNSSALAGKTVVAFEEVSHKGITVTTHTDINDEDQSVHFSKIGTKATIGKEKEVKPGKDMTLTDEISYQNLIPGKEYTFKGVLMDKATKKPLLVNRKEVTQEKTFTAEKADGTESLEFKFDGTKLEGKSVVAFEKLYFGEQEINSHEDINDKGQTVKIKKIVPPEKKKIEKKKGSKISTPFKHSSTPIAKTGDYIKLGVIAALIAACAVLLAMEIKKRRSIRK